MIAFSGTTGLVLYQTFTTSITHAICDTDSTTSSSGTTSTITITYTATSPSDGLFDACNAFAELDKNQYASDDLQLPPEWPALVSDVCRGPPIIKKQERLNNPNWQSRPPPVSAVFYFWTPLATNV